MTEWTVKTHLWATIVELKLQERILAGDDQAVLELITTPAWEALKQRMSFKLVRQDEATERTIKNDKGESIRPTDAIRLALWFIDKVGGVENARMAFSIASTSMTQFYRKSSV